MNIMPLDEVHDALAQLCDGCLRERQRLALMAALRASKGARVAYIRHVSLHFWLRGMLYRGQDPDAEPVTSVRSVRRPVLVAGHRPRQWAMIAGVLATAVSIAFVGLVIRHDGGSHVPPPMAAVVVRAIDCRWSANGLKSIGDVIRNGDSIVLESGTIELFFDSRTRVAARGPVAFQVVSASECDLERGEMMARVLRDGRGFRVTAGTLNVIDQGTEFGVRRLSATEAEVEVFDGTVALRDAQKVPSADAEGEAPVLQAGQTAAVTLGSQTTPQVVRVGATLSAEFMPERENPVDEDGIEGGAMVFDGFSQAGPQGRVDKAGGGAGWTSRWSESRERADTATWVVADGVAMNDRAGLGGAMRGVRLPVGPAQPVYASATLQLASDEPGLPSLVWLTLFQTPLQKGEGGQSTLRVGFGISAREYFCGFGSTAAPVGNFRDQRPRGGFARYKTGQRTRMIGKIEIDAIGPADRLSVWIDPPRGARESDVDPVSVTNGYLEGGLIDKIVLRFACAGDATRASVDDVRLGNSWDAVAD